MKAAVFIALRGVGLSAAVWVINMFSVVSGQQLRPSARRKTISGFRWQILCVRSIGSWFHSFFFIFHEGFADTTTPFLESQTMLYFVKVNTLKILHWAGKSLQQPLNYFYT